MTATTLAHRVARFGAIALLSTATACGGDDGPSGPENVTGTYTLREVNGAAPPATVIEFDDGTSSLKIEILSGTITVNADMTFTATHVVRFTEDNVVVFHGPSPIAGTYTRNGNTLALTTEEGTLTATYANGSLTVVDSEGPAPLTMRYSR